MNRCWHTRNRPDAAQHARNRLPAGCPPRLSGTGRRRARTARVGVSAVAARLCRSAGGRYFSADLQRGMVTSKGGGLAVPDWPNSYGYNMFAFPVSRWVGGVLLEHTHRLPLRRSVF